MRVKHKKSFLVIIMSLQLFLLSILRAPEVGIDTKVYLDRFSYISGYDFSNLFILPDLVDFELGFVLFNMLVSSISDNERFFIIISTAIIIGSVSRYIFKNSKIAWLSFFLFIGLGFWGNSLNVLRQFIAIAFLIISLSFVFKNKFVYFLMFVIISSFFHLSALSFIVVYPLSKIKVTKIYITIFLSLCIVIFIFSSQILSILINLFGYEQHIDRLGDGSGVGMLILLLLIATAAIFYRGNALKVDRNFDIYLHILLVGILLNILALEFDLAGRAMIYFTVHNIIIVPTIIYSIKNKFDRNIGVLLIIIGVLYFYIFRLLLIDVSYLVPYRFLEW